MKGLWDKSKSVNREYRPALDALKAIDHALVTRAMYAVVEQGCALMIGATRDHGAISLTILDGNERHRVYPSNVQELQQALEDLLASFETPSSADRAAKSKR